MKTFRDIFAVALLAGVIAGLASTALQISWAVPLIVKAETYENSAPSMPTTHMHADGTAHVHDHGDEVWAPDDGVERMFWTGITNILLGVAGGLVIASVFSLRRSEATWRTGLGWGAAAFAAIGLAPAFGLPPELPGTAAADLDARQGWWWLAVIAAAVGMACVVYGRGVAIRLIGIAVAVSPHLIGAPNPVHHEALAPEALQHEFIAAALISSAFFWIVLGTAVGYLASKLELAKQGTPEPAAAA